MGKTKRKDAMRLLMAAVVLTLLLLPVLAGAESVFGTVREKGTGAPVIEFLIRRAALSLVTLGVISLVVFAGVRMIPGDPARTLAGADADEAGLDEIREKYGLTDPIPVQYVRWLGLALRGDLGESVRTRESVAWTVARKLPITMELAGLSISVSVLRTPHLLEDRSKIEVGVHGLMVRKGWNRGVLLPKVAVEAGWDGPTFLKHCCLKAGLPAVAAIDPELVVEVFEAEEFGEEQPK